MKNKLIFCGIFLFSLVLTGCGSSTCDPNKDQFCDTDNDDDKELYELADDTNTNYIFDTNINNSNASTNYEIFVRSFYDSDGDGIGDLNGVKEKLSYLQDLGVKNLWLMPINPSSSYHGYDVTDYYGIDSDYGTINDFNALISEAKTYNIGIIMDMVFNHSSDENEWFTDSFNDYVSGNTSSDSKKDWYNWSDNSKEGYSKYPGSSKYYEARFSHNMPDFNLDNQEVRNEILDVCKFWLDKGVAGFRLDATFYYYLTDSKNTEFLSWLNDECKKYKSNCYFVGECWNGQGTTSINASYGSGMDSFFAFYSSIDSVGNGSLISVSKRVNTASQFLRFIESEENAIKTINESAVSSYFLSNHDMDRSSKSLTDENAKLAASITYLMPGTPYIYYGEEIGLKGVRGSNDRSDAKRRLPMVWSKNSNTGKCDFPESNRKDLDDTIQVEDGVIDQLSTNYSLINHYKKVLNVRNKYSFIRDARFINKSSSAGNNENLLLYELVNGTNKILIVTNAGTKNCQVDVSSISNGNILDSINTIKKLPKCENGKLTLGAYSTVIIDAK